MLAAILKVLFKFVQIFGVILGLVFMVACTLFVIACVIHGDIKIKIVEHETEKRKNK